ncbi:MAG: single-stranded DNA-binding protein [Ekhidna sp.]|nr:single-stranded DNA-binding protein [Ekhidna sp.]MBC6425396.1 single-stranded DNA-binding protein [Ekhidna sp.]
MSGVNKVILVGRLGRDPEVRHFESGAAVANFSMATSETYPDRQTGEKKEQTEWHNVAVWRKGLVEVVEKYVKKGDMIYVEGKLKTRSWEKDGITRYSTEVVVDNMTMLGGKAAPFGAESGAMQQGDYGAPTSTPLPDTQAQPSDAPEDDPTDDLPF